MPVEVFHLKVADQPSWGILMDSVRQTVEAARARGVDVAADLYVYTAGGTGLEATIPSWAHEGGTDSLKARLANPQIRARLKREVTTGSPGWWNIIEAAGGWDGVVLVNARNPANAKYEQKNITQIAREMGKEPADAAWDLVAQGHGRVMAIYHMMGEQDIETALRFPWTSIGSDAGAVRAARRARSDGTAASAQLRQFPARHRAVREGAARAHAARGDPQDDRLAGDADAPRRIAARSTAGNWADVTIFDYDALQDRATYEQADGVSDRHRVGAGERRRHDRSRQAHRRQGRPRASRPRRTVETRADQYGARSDEAPRISCDAAFREADATFRCTARVQNTNNSHTTL